MSPFVAAHRLLRPQAAVWLSALPTGGDEGNRTLDPLLAGQVLSQLSYTPVCVNVTEGDISHRRQAIYHVAVGNI